MDFNKKYHISIGSNIGDRLKNIQSSIDLIHSRIASILTLSSIYETESIGFEGDDFFNICATFNSFKSPYYIMNELLEIETLLGRYSCLLYTSPSPRDGTSSRMPSSA